MKLTDLTYSLVGVFAQLALGSALAQNLPDVPRERTLISQGWDFYNQVPSPANFSPYSGVLLHQRNNLHYTVNEMLFYTNHNDNKIIPWQANSFEYNKDFTEITIKLHDNVLWSDGQPFTSEDVVFTLGMLRAAAPDIIMSGAIKEWVASESAPDKLTVKIKLNKPGPRWVSDFLATGQAGRFVVVPKHIWKDQNPRTFGFFDLSKGWPVGTGPYKLVKADSGSLVFDRRAAWWAVGAKVAPAMPVPERIIYRPSSVEALPQLYTNNEIESGGSRIARRPQDLYPEGSKRAATSSNFSKIVGGWYVDTNLNHEGKFSLLLQLNYLARLEFQTDWDFQIQGSTEELADRQRAVVRAREILQELLAL